MRVLVDPTNEAVQTRLVVGRGFALSQIRTAFLNGRISGIVPDFKISQLDAEVRGGSLCAVSKVPIYFFRPGHPRVGARPGPWLPQSASGSGGE